MGLGDQNISEFQQLRSEINAQTEAYVEFSNALVRIFELQKEIKEDIEKLASSDTKEVRELFEKITAMSELLKTYQQSQKEGDDLVSEEIEEYNAVLSHFGSELETFKMKVEGLLADESKVGASNREAIIAAIEGLEEAVESQHRAMKGYVDESRKHHRESREKLDQIITYHLELNKVRSVWEVWRQRAMWVVGTLGVLWAIVQSLVGVGVMKSPVELFKQDKPAVVQQAPETNGSNTSLNK